jgi:hypothetical protein
VLDAAGLSLFRAVVYAFISVFATGMLGLGAIMGRAALRAPREARRRLWALALTRLLLAAGVGAIPVSRWTGAALLVAGVLANAVVMRRLRAARSA